MLQSAFWGIFRHIQYFRYKIKLIQYTNQLNPICVITTTDLDASDRVMLDWCLKHKRPYIIIQSCLDDDLKVKHSSMYKPLKERISYLFWKGLLGNVQGRRHDIFGEENPNTHLILWSREFLYSPHRNKVYFLGNPSFDQFFRKNPQDQKKKNTVLICTQPLGSNLSNYTLESTIFVIKNRPEYHFFVKIHPRDKKEIYEKIFREKITISNYEIIKDTPLYDLFSQSGVQISISSTTSFEALASGIPVITLEPDTFIQKSKVFEEDIFIKAKTKEQFLEKLDSIMKNPNSDNFFINRDAFFKKYITFTDGQSGNRILKKILDILD
jgi:hypothetical protein